MSINRNAVDLDDIDFALLRLLVDRPRDGMREYARVLGVARGTVQNRAARLIRQGVVRNFAADVDPAALGYPVLGFAHLHLAQGRLEAVSTALATIPEVIEAHSITGDSDVFCRVVARHHLHLEDVVQRILGLPGVVRIRTELALHERVARRILPLLDGPVNASG
ncbi:Lrp/AsnC family transcriptional regulator [Jatrophihabitans sp. DSM 45814]